MKLPVLTSRMFYLGPQCARTAFTVLTVARCASAGTVPAATTSQEPAYAPPAGQDHTAFWVMEATSLKRGVREALTANPSRHPLLKHKYDVFVNNYLYNETLPMTFLGMGKGGERGGEDKRALWHTWFN